MNAPAINSIAEATTAVYVVMGLVFGIMSCVIVAYCAAVFCRRNRYCGELEVPTVEIKITASNSDMPHTQRHYTQQYGEYIPH